MKKHKCSVEWVGHNIGDKVWVCRIWDSVLALVKVIGLEISVDSKGQKEIRYVVDFPVKRSDGTVQMDQHWYGDDEVFERKNDAINAGLKDIDTEIQEQKGIIKEHEDFKRVLLESMDK